MATFEHETTQSIPSTYTMVRRLMSRRGGSASQPQVTSYQQLELDDGWREWENTKQELVLVKRQLVEKDALIVQLKTGTRRLQETLRKKDKDLHAAFAILRSPQEAKSTKTRKQELIDRLVSECMQRAVIAETLAEERKRELDRLKYSRYESKELEVEIEECHTEIERLRAKIATTAPSPIVAGKLRVSSVPLLPANGGGGLSKKIKLNPLSLPEDDEPENQPSASSPTKVTGARMYAAHSSSGHVRVVPLAKFHHREGFVSKTRRRALEAEYYKQVRLAQLEVECELEENLHIRAAREARKLQSLELQDRQTELMLDTARSQPADLEVQGGEWPNKGQSSDDLEKTTRSAEKPEQPQIPVDNQEAEINELVVASEAQYTEIATADIVATSPQDPTLDGKHQNGLEGDLKTEGIRECVDDDYYTDDVPKHQKQKTYEDDDFDASNDDIDAKHTVWNVDPNPRSSSQLDRPVNLDQSADVNSNNMPDRTVWNVDPVSLASAESPMNSEETDIGNVVWNVDPRPPDSTTLSGNSVIDSNNDVEENIPLAPALQEQPTQREDETTSQVWNLDPTPSISVNENLDNTSDGEASSPGGDVEDNIVWNLNPAPSPGSVPHTNIATDGKPCNADAQPSAWNLEPESVPDNISLSPTDNVNEAEFVAEVATEETEDSSSTTANAETPSEPRGTTNNEGGGGVWNLDPEPPSSSSPTILKDEHLDPSEQLVPDTTALDENDGGETSSKTWNLNPNMSDKDAIENVNDIGRSSPASNGGNERSVWNLDPHAGDANEPTPNSDNEMHGPVFKEDAEGTSPDSGKPQVDLSIDETGPTSSRSETQTLDASPSNPTEAVTTTTELHASEELENATSEYDGVDYEEEDMADEPEPTERTSENASNQNSARESQPDSPMNDDTPEYTPPSSARDESGDDNADDTTW